METGERMTKADGINLKNGTPLLYVDSSFHHVGFVEYDNEIGNYIFHNKTPQAKFQLWTISNWNYYSVITESEFVLFMMENA